jgi:hypothetical protein
MQRIELERLYGPNIAFEWGSDPNLRARIKEEMADALATKMRIADLIDFVVTKDKHGDTRIVASVMAARTGDEK